MNRAPTLLLPKRENTPTNSIKPRKPPMHSVLRSYYQPYAEQVCQGLSYVLRLIKVSRQGGYKYSYFYFAGPFSIL